MGKCGTLAAIVIGLFTANASAQDVKWRHDYAAARKEAAATGKPLLLDFGTEACTWCKKLDATTFRNPAVVSQLNDRFIPVKIDAGREERLTEAVKVDSFPTLLLVSADGKIVGRHVGYADVTQLNGLLGKAPAPEKVAATPQAAANPAAEMLMRARADHDGGNFLACIERCDQISATFPGTPEAASARDLAKRIAADPEKWTRVTGQVETDLAALRNALKP
jgi:thioredoxin-like negative regulator of GroEL